MRSAVSFTGPLLLCVAIASGAQQTEQTTPPVPPVSTTVVVLGELEPASLGESARTATVMDTQAHPLASQSTEDYLRTDASIDIQQQASAGILDDISVRGATFEQTLVLLNGLRIDDAETSHFNLDLPVPLAALSSIDVLHGEGSTQYGSDAIGGVVDFLTLDPVADTLQLRAGAGSFGEDQEGVLASYVGKHFSELVAGDLDRSDLFIIDRDYRTEDASSETRIATALGKTDILFAGDDRAFGANDFYNTPAESFERTKGWFAAMTQELSEHTLVDAAYRRHSDIYVYLRDDPSFYKNQHIDDSYEGDVRDHRTLSRRGTLLTGIEETTDEIHSNQLGDHGRNRTAGFAEFEWRVPQRWSVSAGLRAEFFSGGTVVSSPMASATYLLPHSLKIRAAIGHGFRQPTYVDLYYSDPTHVGNPNLKPESAWNYEGGLDWYPTGKSAFTLTGFTSRQSNTIDYARPNSNALWMATNLGGLSFTGIESSFDWQPNLSQHVKLSWTYEHGTQGALNGLQDEYVFNYPTNNARADWTWNIHHQLLLQSRLGVLQRFRQTAYPVLDISAVHEIGRWRPYLRATNVTNTGYVEYPGVQMPGRGFVGGVELVFSHAR